MEGVTDITYTIDVLSPLSPLSHTTITCANFELYHLATLVAHIKKKKNYFDIWATWNWILYRVAKYFYGFNFIQNYLLIKNGWRGSYLF